MTQPDDSRDDVLLVPDLTVDVRYEEQGGLTALIADRLGISADAIADLTLLRRSLDARRRRFHYRVRAELVIPDAGARKRALRSKHARPPEVEKRVDDHAILDGLTPGTRSLDHRPVIIGTGPSGLFAAWLLAEYGFAPIVLERGRRVEKRVKDVRDFEQGGDFREDSNILFGEGGAGTFSDGKLTCRTRSPIKPLILELMIACSAPAEIAWQAKAHVGTDRLRAVLVHLRRRLVAKGVEFRFESCMEDLILDSEGRIAGVRLAGGEDLKTESVFLGIGHSARDTYRRLLERGIAMEFKPFQLGLRVEHRQEQVDRFRYGGDAAGLHLPTAEYSLKAGRLCGDRQLYSFCMCPGGHIVPSVNEAGTLCTNGMSRHARASGWANSGLVYTVREQDLERVHPLAGVELQERIERRAYAMGAPYEVPAQTIDDFLAARLSDPARLESSYPLGHVAADLRELLPAGGPELMRRGLQRFEGIWRGFTGSGGLLVGPESRGSSPVRIPRDDDSRESTSTPGLYPMGEGAGYAGGIMSAALDGIRSARKLIEARAPAQ